MGAGSSLLRGYTKERAFFTKKRKKKLKRKTAPLTDEELLRLREIARGGY